MIDWLKEHNIEFALPVEHIFLTSLIIVDKRGYKWIIIGRKIMPTREETIKSKDVPSFNIKEIKINQ